MAVERFRTFEEARRALWRRSGDPANLERMRQLGEFARAPRQAGGISRFRTIQEAKAGKRCG